MDTTIAIIVMQSALFVSWLLASTAEQKRTEKANAREWAEKVRIYRAYKAKVSSYNQGQGS